MDGCVRGYWGGGGDVWKDVLEDAFEGALRYMQACLCTCEREVY